MLKLITILLMEKILILSEFIYYGNGLQLMPVFLELPIPVVKRTNLSSLQPTGDAVEVEGMVYTSNTSE